MTNRDTFAVALLRGINVGGKNKLPMQALADIFAAAGCTDVKTYIQSGNVVFRAARTKGLAEAISSAIQTQFDLSVPVILRTARELQDAIARNPFLQADIDPNFLHVMFLDGLPSTAQIASLDPARSHPDAFAVVGRDVYLHLPNGGARTKLTNAWFDSKLKTVSTQRNWRTVLALAEMMRD